ncbi:MAG: hypothetical protein E7131_03145 [Rikenellaceae bacterium]|nr:hypothetical protein [Rikenellaceae bacterium]
MSKKTKEVLHDEFEQLANELKGSANMEHKSKSKSSREHFIFYISFYESIMAMDKRYRIRALQVLCEYALYDKSPDPTLPKPIELCFINWKRLLDAAKRRYDKKVALNMLPNEDKQIEN